MQDTVDLMNSKAEKVVSGLGLERVAGCSKVVLPLLLQEQMQQVQRVGSRVQALCKEFHQSSPASTSSETSDPLPAFPRKHFSEPEVSRLREANPHPGRLSHEKYSEFAARFLPVKPDLSIGASRKDVPLRERCERIDKELEEVITTTTKWAATAEDKSWKETWISPAPLFCALAVWTALVAGWTLYPDISPSQAEFAVRGFWADNVPMRMRRFIGTVMAHPGTMIPYFYITVKLKCFAGSGSQLHTCTKQGHSCCRKVVSYFRIVGPQS